MSIQIGGQCKDCKWWVKNAKMKQGWALCKCKQVSSKVGFAEYYGPFGTYRTFGCVMFDARGKGEE